ncbi:ribose-phosphate diphosphokinase [uncultured Limosilactobacillus sp.]|uniref:ribose-phosphate diphosphokinase n=1 Tax=uncultured Limosilactobacillus sp. TaxID=2837629 RepID=UPI0025FB95C0|nr:ribose-phosphate diphosphokinase [uncultured Limosilactobacillus sp.]
MSELQNAADVRLFALNSNRPLAEKIAEELGLPLSECTVSHFADGEISITINESVRGREVYVIQSTSDPVNDNLMELLIMIDALRRASAKKINVVLPYYGYARQDRKARSREPITAKLVANLLELDQIDRLIAVDLHAAQVQGFFDIPVDHLQADPTLAKYFLDQAISDDLVIVSPDHAGMTMARRFAELLGDDVSVAIVDKRTEDTRENPDLTMPSMIIGDVKDKVAIIVDDIIDTGNRLTNSAELVSKKGAKEVFAVATHPVLSGDASERIQASAIKEMVTTDTIVVPETKQFDKLKQLSVAPLLAEAIIRIHNHQSIHHLFKI